MPIDNEQRDREIRYIATSGSVGLGAIALTAKHEHIAWLCLLCAAGVWVVAMIATRRTD